jgi:hypothetical protein
MKTQLSELPVVTEGFTHEQDIWLQSLEDGGFKQTKKHLRDPDGFCCLGVACHVNRIAYNVLSEQRGPSGVYDFFCPDGTDDPDDPAIVYKETDCLPHEVRDGMHFGDEYGTLVNVGDQCESLTSLNDNSDWTFAQIANLCRRAPWTVFINFERPSDVSDELDIHS